MDFYAEQLRDELDALLQPLYQRRALVESDIAATEERLRILKRAKKQVDAVLRESSRSLGPEPKKKKTGTTTQISQERMQRFEQWLSENREEINAGSGINGSGLAREHSELFGNQSSANKALKALHERGVLVLDSVGPYVRKNYKVV